MEMFDLRDDVILLLSSYEFSPNEISMSSGRLASWYSTTALTSLAALVSGTYCISKGWETYNAQETPSDTAAPKQSSSISPVQQSQFHISASSLSNDVQHALMKDKGTTDHAINLVVEVFKSEQVLGALKDVFVSEFTENEATIAALKKFLLDDVINDPHVRDTLIGFAQSAGLQLLAEPDIWPGKTVDLLKNAAIDGLSDEEFLLAVLQALKAGAMS